MYHYQTALQELIDHLGQDDEIEYANTTGWELGNALNAFPPLHHTNEYNPEEHDYDSIYIPTGYTIPTNPDACLCVHLPWDHTKTCARLCNNHNQPCTMTEIGHCN